MDYADCRLYTDEEVCTHCCATECPYNTKPNYND